MEGSAILTADPSNGVRKEVNAETNNVILLTTRVSILPVFTVSQRAVPTARPHSRYLEFLEISALRLMHKRHGILLPAPPQSDGPLLGQTYFDGKGAGLGVVTRLEFPQVRRRTVFNDEPELFKL